MTSNTALATFAQGQSKLWEELAKSLTSSQASGPVTEFASATPMMTQTTAWYAKHSGVLKKVAAKGGNVPLAEFFKYAEEAGYSGASYSQLYRKNGLLKRDDGDKTIAITAKGTARLAFAKNYLAERGFEL